MNRLRLGNHCVDCDTLIDKKAHRCRSCHVKRQHKMGFLKHPTGEQAPRWKGGKTITTGGYVAIMMPGHHRATKRGYVFEHIVAWEKANGRLLPDGWVVHHLNGIKDDNRPTNLAGLPSKKHYLIFAVAAKRIQELEALLKKQGQLI